MEVEFELTLDDLLAFNQYHTSHSPVFRRQRLKARFAVPIVVAGIWLILLGFSDPPAQIKIISGVFLGLSAMIYFLIFPSQMRSRTRRLVERSTWKAKIGASMPDDG